MNRITNGHEVGANQQSVVWRMAIVVGFFFAFSPALFELLAHARDYPWARPSLIFPWLVWIAALRNREPIEAVRWGWLAVAVGLVIELLAISGGVIRVARIGIILAAVGMGRGFGWCSAGVASLMLWGIPVPYVLISSVSPLLESTWAGFATELANLLGLTLLQLPGHLESSAGSLELLPVDGGLVLVISLAGLGWFRMLFAPRRPLAKLWRSALFAAAGFPLQITALTLATMALGLGIQPQAIRLSLTLFPWLTVWGLAALFVWMSRNAKDVGDA